jgi:hypothetical protein
MPYQPAIPRHDETRGDQVTSRMSWRGLSSLVVLAVLLLGGGCSQQAQLRDDLLHALSQSHSALGSAALTMDLLGKSRITRAAAETAVDDMSQQIGEAQSQLEPISIDDDAQQADRDATLQAVDSGLAALLLLRDQLRQDQDTANAQSAIARADREITALSSRLQAGG